MRLRDLKRCTRQDPRDLIDLSSHVLGKSVASLTVEDLSLSELNEVMDVLLSYPPGYPIPYIIREVPFYGRRFYVDERVLIPRSETEGIIDIVLSLGIRPEKVADVGTGSGVIGITLKLLLPDSTVILTDVSLDALKVARMNAQRMGAEVLMVLTDLLAGVTGRLDLIVSNPPYVPEEDVGKYDPKVLYEPRIALSGGKTGFEVTERLLKQGMERLKPGGYMVLETDSVHFSRFPKGTTFKGRFAVLRKE